MTSVVRQGHGIVLGLILVDPVWGSWGASEPLQYWKNTTTLAKIAREKTRHRLSYTSTVYIMLYILQSTSVYTQARIPIIHAHCTALLETWRQGIRCHIQVYIMSVHLTKHFCIYTLHRPLPIRPMYTTQPYTRDMQRGGASGGWSSHPPVIRTKPTG